MTEQESTPRQDTTSTGPGGMAGGAAGPGSAGSGNAGPARPDESLWSEGTPASQGREWLAQLQSMIENLATQAVPVAREIGAKAAELAAVAADKAGPIAAKAAEVTADAGTRFAERSRTLATELRRDAEAEAARRDGSPAGDTASGSAGTAGSSEEDASRRVG